MPRQPSAAASIFEGEEKTFQNAASLQQRRSARLRQQRLPQPEQAQRAGKHPGLFGFRRKLHFSSFNVSSGCCRHENPNTSRARLMWFLVSCRVFNLLPGLETSCLILLSADSRVVSSGGPGGATSHLRIINPSPVLNLGLFDDDWATFGFKFRFFFFFLTC